MSSNISPWIESLEPELLQLGDTSIAVTTLQRTLTAIGLYRRFIDGYFGPATEQAVRQLQNRLDIAETGKFDKATWHALAVWPKGKNIGIASPIRSRSAIAHHGQT